MKNIYTFTAIFLLLAMLIIPAFSIKTERAPAPEGSVSTPDIKSGGNFKVLISQTSEVITVSESDYVWGAVAAEMGPSYSDEALKAQAVAAYTFAARRRKMNGETVKPEMKGADISDNPELDQSFMTREKAKEKWGTSFENNAAKLDNAVKAVTGTAVLYNGDFALTAYHDISSGKTESAKVIWGTDIPYLIPVESIGDLLSPGYQSVVSLTAEEFISKAASLGVTLTGDPAGFPDKNPVRSPSGTVTSYKLGDKTFTGMQIRAAFSLRSANFDLDYKDEKLIFNVRGYGHGVGMSQAGAEFMSKQGSTYVEILMWYYPGCEVKKV